MRRRRRCRSSSDGPMASSSAAAGCSRLLRRSPTSATLVPTIRASRAKRNSSSPSSCRWLRPASRSWPAKAFIAPRTPSTARCAAGSTKAPGGGGGAAINFFFPWANAKAADVLRLAGGSGVLAMTAADYAHPEVGPLMDKWLIGPGIDAKRRLELMKLAWDLTGSEFGSRAGLYERLYSGDPEINAQRWFRSAITRECEQLVRDLLKP